MSKKYTALAKDIVEKVGGNSNITNAYHCQTRLRFSLKDESIADTKGIESLDGVLQVIQNGGVYQICIGTHVADVFEEVEQMIDIKPGNDAPAEKKSAFETVIDFVSGVFQPVIPALSGAGMIKAVMALLVVFNLIATDSQTYYLLNMFADGVFYFLPMMLAFTTAQKLKCNPILAAAVAAIMMHPNWGALVAAGEPVHFFEIIPFTLTNYTSSVIPILLVIFVQKYVEAFLNKYIPKSVNLVFVPLFTLLIMGTLALSVLGPLGAIVGGWLASIFNYLSANAAWAPSVLIGGLLPVMVMFGLHNGVAPLGVMQMAELGYDSIFGPGCVCSNMAQATAGAVVAFRTRSKQTRQIATSGAITAYMGITEPILYGINLPKKYPLYAAMIGGACGGLYAGLTQTHRFATGSSGLPAVLLYIGDNSMTYFYNILIAIVISIVVSGIAAWFMAGHFEKKEQASSKEAEPVEVELTEEEIAAPLDGTVIALEDSADPVFSSGAMGKGIVIDPASNTVVAPVDGTISVLFPTKHAIGITTADGKEILIHVGVDTVDLGGKGFESFVSQGDAVKAGQPLVRFDPEVIKNAGLSSQTMILVTNSADYADVIPASTGTVKAGNVILQVKK